MPGGFVGRPHQVLRENGMLLARLFWRSWEASGPAIWCGRGAKRQETPQSTSGAVRAKQLFQGWQRRRNQRPIRQTFHRKDGLCLPGSPAGGAGGSNDECPQRRV